MRRNIVFIMILTILYFGCKKMAPEMADDPDQTNCTPQFPDKNVTYNNYVKNIITMNCTKSCHKGGNSLGTGNFTSYAGIVPHIDAFYFRVIQDRADMPQGSAPLPKSTRDSLNIWIKNCNPEN